MQNSAHAKKDSISVRHSLPNI